MGKHLKEVRKLDKAIGKFRDGLKIILGVLERQTAKERDLIVASYATMYAYFNYNFAIYLISKFPKAVNSDKTDKEFNDIVKNISFKKKRRKKR